ncbi:MAG: TolB-like 6-bladed beta-propeller domain-containing protein [Clostridium sp.]|nr:TolB-like 6-bladed beta-propeller domain-containing protein [Clostridium sp.]
MSFAFLTACSTADNTEDINRTINPDEFSAVDMAGKGVILTENPEILGIISGIEAINNSAIAICQNRQDAHVIIYNPETDSAQTVIKRGDGPDEMLRVSTMSTGPEGTLWLSGMMDKKVVSVRMDNGVAVTSPEFRLPEDFLRGATDGNNGIIGLPATRRDCRLARVDQSGQIVDTLGVFPSVESEAEVSPSNFMFQSDIAYLPETEKAVVVCKSWNFIDIVDTRKNETISLTWPLDEPIKLEKFEMGAMVSYNPKPMWLMFSGVDVTPKSIFVGYIGKKVESPEDIDTYSKTILEFDWNGKPVNKYEFENGIVAFSVSADGNNLYTVENDPDPIMYKYSLNK